jgi:mRNA interferase MazF
MAPGEIHLAYFPYGDVPGMKLRPVLLLTPPVGPVPELLVAYISSAMPSVVLASDLIIDPTAPQFATTNLKQLSVLRLHKQATLHQKTIIRFLGSFSPPAQLDVENRLRTLLGL